VPGVPPDEVKVLLKPNGIILVPVGHPKGYHTLYLLSLTEDPAKTSGRFLKVQYAKQSFHLNVFIFCIRRLSRKQLRFPAYPFTGEEAEPMK
jgi:hypothetical protein